MRIPFKHSPAPEPGVVRICAQPDKPCRVAVISDSHGYDQLLRRAVELAGEVDLCLHLGDCTRDMEIIRMLRPCWKVLGVRGNNDFDRGIPEELCVEIGGARLLAVHGHRCCSLQHLVYQALEKSADAVLFGHSHRALLDRENGVFLINPGSVALPRGGAPATFALLEICRGEIRSHLIEV